MALAMLFISKTLNEMFYFELVAVLYLWTTDDLKEFKLKVVISFLLSIYFADCTFLSMIFLQFYDDL